MITFSRPVIVGSTAADCPASAMLRRTAAGCRATSRPFTRSVPASGRISVATRLTKVVLPAPFGPSSAITWPGSMVRFNPSSAEVLPNLLTRPAASSVEVISNTIRLIERLTVTCGILGEQC